MFTIFENALSTLNSIVWGPGMLILLVGTGLYLTLRLRFLSLRSIPKGFRLLWQGRSKLDSVEGELSPFNALMTALAATVGTGNIVGVATAILAAAPERCSGCGVPLWWAWRPNLRKPCWLCIIVRSRRPETW